MLVFFAALFFMICGHALADYAWQSEFIALGKNPKTNDPKKGVPWYYILGAHCLHHGLLVGIITGSLGCGLVETIWHFVLDSDKNDGKINIHEDQAFHILCKVVWAIVAALDGVWWASFIKA